MNRFEKILLGGEWSEQRSSSWAAQTAKGKWPYIIKYGVCYWGGFLFCILSIASIAQAKPGNEPDFFFTFMLCIFSSLIYGLATWHLGCKAQKEYLSKETALNTIEK